MDALVVLKKETEMNGADLAMTKDPGLKESLTGMSHADEVAVDSQSP